MISALLPWLRLSALVLAGWVVASLLTTALVVSWLRLRAVSQASLERQGRRAAWRAAAQVPAAAGRTLLP